MRMSIKLEASFEQICKYLRWGFTRPVNQSSCVTVARPASRRHETLAIIMVVIQLKECGLNFCN